MTGLTLDAGALIAIDRNTDDARALVRRALAHGGDERFQQYRSA